MAAWTKERCEHPIGREKPLGVSGRLETPHATFSFSRWLVRILRAIVRSSILYVLDIGQYLCLGGGITAQLVGDDGPRDVLQSLQQLAKEFLGSLSIAKRLHQDIEHLAVRIDGAPQIIQLAIDRQVDFIESQRSPGRGVRDRSRLA